MHAQRALPSLSPPGERGCLEIPPGEVSSGCPDSAGPGWSPGLGEGSGAHTHAGVAPPVPSWSEAF